MSIRRLVPADAPAYRGLMLEGYADHPDAFTSSVSERAAMPLAWWESRLSANPRASEVVFGSMQGDELAGVAGLAFESREKARHKATLFGMYVPRRFRYGGVGGELVLAALAHARAAMALS